ncbi:MAG: CoA transferase [Novosphingobium sp.]|nr:CoA transferase [Novosphingobium sp.]
MVRNLVRVPAEMILDHIRIVELGSHIAAPATAALLADWGASVIKVEQHDGDPIRWQFPAPDRDVGSAVFEMDNRGKRSIALDYRHPDGRAVLEALIAQADVFITNRLPGSLKRAGLDYETIHARFPALVYTSITGYGLQGPAADVGSFDIQAFWSRSGLGGAMWPDGVEHLSWRPGVGDHIAALAAALGTAVALIDRARTGEGRLVDSSLLRAGTYAGGFDLAEQLRNGEIMQTPTRQNGGNRPSSYYLTCDGQWICLWAKDQAEWRAIFTALDRPDLCDDLRFAEAEALADNAAAMTGILESVFVTLSSEEVARRFQAAGVTWAPVLRPHEVIADPWAQAAGCFVDVSDGHGGSYPAPAPPVRLAGGDAPKGPPPRVGEHSEAVLKELGYPPDEIARLIEQGVVGPFAPLR